MDQAGVYGTSWVADDHQAWVTSPDGTRTEIPKFSDLFPGMELPKVTHTDLPSMQEIMARRNMNPTAASAEAGASFTGNVYVPVASAQTPPYFYSFAVKWNTRVDAAALTLPGTSWNVGFSDLLNGNKMIDHITNLGLYDIFSLDVNPAPHYAVHASTFSTPGYALLDVYG